MLETGKQNINLNLLGRKGQFNKMFFFWQITQFRSTSLYKYTISYKSKSFGRKGEIEQDHLREAVKNYLAGKIR